MPRKTKFPKLPNGWGQIRYLGKGRRNPYGVYPPATEEYDNGRKKPPSALCYVSDRMVGLAVLTSYHSGTYKPGDEVVIEQQMRAAEAGKKFFDRILANYNRAMFQIEPDDVPTFGEVFRRYYLNKFGDEYGHSGPKKSMETSMIAAYKNSSSLHDCTFKDIKADQMQAIVDEVSYRLSHSSAELVVTLFRQMTKYALANDLAEKNYAQFIRIKIDDDDEHGVPFSETDIQKLWAHKDDPTVEMLLIMCYSGFRISEYKGMEVNLKDRYFCGGLKSAAGRGRIVPIHSCILPLVERRIRRDKKILYMSVGNFRSDMYSTLELLAIERHTPHDCRHTFSMLCEKYKVSENDRKRMLGHALDLTNGVYGHRTVEELREEIEKIMPPVNLL